MAAAVIALFITGCERSSPPHVPAAQVPAVAACPANDSGLTVPAGFCATVFADGIGHARHMAVAANGVVYVNPWGGAYYGKDPQPAGGFLVALKDSQRLGKADTIRRFGETVESGGRGGTGIAIFNGQLYVEIDDRIVRYTLSDNDLVPQGSPEVIVAGLTMEGDHPMHPFAIDAAGMMYVDVASATNSCQVKNREKESPGREPCKELEIRGGIWRYDANRTGQKFSPADRYVSGIRNAGGIAVDSANQVYATQHGRDQLAENWPKLYTPEQGATLPAEELLHIEQGALYGWPHCYYDPAQGKLVLAPEYGGDGGKHVGLCAERRAPVAAFPAHWAPTAMVFYQGTQFPERYRAGAFIAFHGSWNRAPFQQGGYNVVFQPFEGGKAAPGCEIFADGFAGAVRSPDGAMHRPTGLASGPDGALYISDDVKGRIYRVTYRGGADARSAAAGTPCPSASAPPAREAEVTEDVAALPVPAGFERETIVLGSNLYHAEGGATTTCVGCHGANGTGTALGPDLTDQQWLWSDGSVAGIAKSISDGVSQPRNYRNPMPAMGGAQLTNEQVSAIAAYVWSLNKGK
jgi:glucose/arabinose dehydrogenase/mono/diheme cytochrome c family protein